MREKFPFLSVVMCEEPKTLVAKGAALCCAGQLKPDSHSMVVVDVTPLTIGVEMADGRMAPIVPKNSVLPVKQSRVFTTTKENERHITINVYQGERPFCKDNAFIGKIEVKLNRYYEKNEARIMTLFQVTADGTLSIRVTELNEQIEVTTTFSGETIRLGEERIQNIQKEAEEHREIDAIREQECMLRGRLSDLLRVLETNACNIHELSHLTEKASSPQDLKKIIDMIHSEYRRYLLC
jgi:molecular chaperone DnaK (HSP70)